MRTKRNKIKDSVINVIKSRVSLGLIKINLKLICKKITFFTMLKDFKVRVIHNFTIYV